MSGCLIHGAARARLLGRGRALCVLSPRLSPGLVVGVGGGEAGVAPVPRPRPRPGPGHHVAAGTRGQGLPSHTRPRCRRLLDSGLAIVSGVGQ